MSHQFRQGDLAVTLGHLVQIPAGSVVELVKRVPAGHLFRTSGLLALEEGWVASSGNGVLAYYANKHLLPLRGDFTPERQKTQEVPV